MRTIQPRHASRRHGRQEQGQRRRGTTHVGALGRPVGSIDHLSMDGLRPPYLPGP